MWPQCPRESHGSTREGTSWSEFQSRCTPVRAVPALCPLWAPPCPATCRSSPFLGGHLASVPPVHAQALRCQAVEGRRRNVDLKPSQGQEGVVDVPSRIGHHGKVKRTGCSCLMDTHRTPAMQPRSPPPSCQAQLAGLRGWEAGKRVSVNPDAIGSRRSWHSSPPSQKAPLCCRVPTWASQPKPRRPHTGTPMPASPVSLCGRSACAVHGVLGGLCNGTCPPTQLTHPSPRLPPGASGVPMEPV